MKKLLVYTQDPGGTRCTLPILRSWVNCISAIFIFHPLALPLARSSGFEISSSVAKNEVWPITRLAWKKILQQQKITHVLCTLSSPYLDPSNIHLVEVARELGIPSLGFMDHWKGYDRFYDAAGLARYFTDWIGCIDAHCRNEFLRRGISGERLSIVGHAGLEQTLQRCTKTDDKPSRKVLLVSQPDIQDESFRGIFFKKWMGKRIIDEISEVFCSSPTFSLGYRSHPKEKGNDPLPPRVTRDQTASTEEALLTYDIFIGLDSMMLFEASLLGRTVLLLEMPEVFGRSQGAIPYFYGIKVGRFEGMDKYVSETVQHIHTDLISLAKNLQGSVQRGRDLITSFLCQSHCYQ